MKLEDLLGELISSAIRPVIREEIRAALLVGGRNEGREHESPEVLWTVDDVARYLRASRSWVYDAAEIGKLHPLRIGGLLRFEPQDVRAFAHGNLMQPQPPDPKRVSTPVEAPAKPRTAKSTDRMEPPVSTPLITTPVRTLEVPNGVRAEADIVALDKMLSARQAAEQLGVSRATIYKLCDNGELAHSRVMNAIRIDPKDLRALLDKR